MTTPNDLTISDLLSQKVDIASPPEVFLKITEILDNPAKNAIDAAKIIENDPGLTSRLLKIVNSAFFGFPASITSVSRAISIIGTVELRNLVLATIVVDRFQRLNAKMPTMREFWITSIRCALFSKALAKRLPQSIDLSLVFVCGLLHNIGSLVLFDRVPERVNAAAELSQSSVISIGAAEKKVLGFDHFEVGAELALLWRLPESIEKTIRYHNHDEKSTSFRDEITVVSIADFLSKGTFSNSNSELIEMSGNSRITDLFTQDPNLPEALTNEVDSQFPEIFQLIYHV